MARKRQVASIRSGWALHFSETSGTAGLVFSLAGIINCSMGALRQGRFACDGTK
jgi:hypothetical protein